MDCYNVFGRDSLSHVVVLVFEQSHLAEKGKCAPPHLSPKKDADAPPEAARLQGSLSSLSLVKDFRKNQEPEPGSGRERNNNGW